MLARHVHDAPDIPHADDALDFLHKELIPVFEFGPQFVVVHLGQFDFDISSELQADVVGKNPEDDSHKTYPEVVAVDLAVHPLCELVGAPENILRITKLHFIFERIVCQGANQDHWCADFYPVFEFSKANLKY